jgi:hypothetical protein
MPVVLPEKFSTKGWEPVLTVNGQVNVEAGKLGVLDVMVKPLALVEPDHTADPLKLTFLMDLLRVAQIRVIESM